MNDEETTEILRKPSRDTVQTPSWQHREMPHDGVYLSLYDKEGQDYSLQITVNGEGSEEAALGHARAFSVFYGTGGSDSKHIGGVGFSSVAYSRRGRLSPLRRAEIEEVYCFFAREIEDFPDRDLLSTIKKDLEKLYREAVKNLDGDWGAHEPTSSQ